MKLWEDEENEVLEEDRKKLKEWIEGIEVGKENGNDRLDNNIQIK